MDVFFYEAFDEEERALRRHNHERLDCAYTWKTIQEEGHTEPPAPIISVRTQSIIPPAWAPKLKAILTRSTGYDHIETYRRNTDHNHLPAGYLPRYCHRAVAEQAMLLWTALLRRLPEQIAQFGQFERNGLTGTECEGKRILVAGVGNIGSEIVRIARGLGMKPTGVDPMRRLSDLPYTHLQDALPKSDIIICSMNLTQDNKALFNYDTLKTAKRGALFINIARGELSPSRDLIRLLDERILGGVGLDVYNEESELAIALRQGAKPTSDEAHAALELACRPNVILTPHNSFNTHEAVDRKGEHAIRQLLSFKENEEFLWALPDPDVRHRILAPND